jgi:hypothetical protein
MEAAQRLGMSLHPLIAQTVERQFLLGEYELAVFAAHEAGRDNSAGPGWLPEWPARHETHAGSVFSPSEPGPLADTDTEAGERVATMELFKGAIGLFKNRSSHRAVDYDDPTLAAEVILLADLLLRMLNERLERRGNEESST